MGPQGTANLCFVHLNSGNVVKPAGDIDIMMLQYNTKKICNAHNVCQLGSRWWQWEIRG